MSANKPKPQESGRRPDQQEDDRQNPRKPAEQRYDQENPGRNKDQKSGDDR